MPITIEDLFQFRSEKLKQRESFEEKAAQLRDENERQVKRYEERLQSDYNLFYANEGGKLDAELNYLDFLIQEEEKKGEVL